MVNLVWITPDAEKHILYMARVSNPKNQNSSDTRLLSYLVEHAHWSPFEMINMCVEIETSRAISAQLIRHRSFSFQEYSQRYAEVPSIEPIELRKQAEKNRQSSTEVINPSLSNFSAKELVDECITQVTELYKELVRAGVSRETARMILPLASTTKLYMNGSVRSWIHYIQLRTKEDTQKEHREIAGQVKNILLEQIPSLEGLF